MTSNSNTLIVLAIMFSTVIASNARVHFNKCFDGISSTQTQADPCINHAHHITQKDTRAFGPMPADVEKGHFTEPEPSLISSVELLYTFKAFVFIMILALISRGVTALVRVIFNRSASVGPDRPANEENELMHNGVASVGPEMITSEENEAMTIELGSVGPEWPIYEPRPIRDPTHHYTFTCNAFSLFG